MTGTAHTFSRPLVEEPAELVFGRALHPLHCGLGLAIGSGAVYPEINFTLPPMTIDVGSWPAVREIYADLCNQILARARRLALDGLVIEFEHLPPMTAEPRLGAEITTILKQSLRRAHEEWGLRSALRVTIVDLRDETHPPQRRGGRAWNRMRESLKTCAAAGADVLSIESTGGKEVHDAALTRGDLPGIVFALGELAARDMAWLWSEIAGVAQNQGVVAGGDSACGFANTAMQLAEMRMLPEVVPAVVRAMSAARSLVAFERGAVGPSKDCAYEGPVLKAITGCPISMEGRSATCAHLSPLGNIAAAFADLWSNESVPDVRLLSGPAPVAAFESLVYDCRLLNAALASGQQDTLRDLHVASDARLSPQAALLTPGATIRLALAITAEADPYRRTVAAGRTAVSLLESAAREESLALKPVEVRWLERLRHGFDALPDSPEPLRAAVQARYGALFDPGAYGLDP